MGEGREGARGTRKDRVFQEEGTPRMKVLRQDLPGVEHVKPCDQSRGNQEKSSGR